MNEPAAQTLYSAVSGSLFGANGPSYLDVEQGDLGDCWLLASLAAVAARDPADIRSMFTADGTAVENGSAVSLYTVRFYNSNGVAQYVTVDTELPSGGDYYDNPANGVLWVALAEKAYAEANGAGIVTTMSRGSDAYAALNGGDPAWALQAITGKSANDFAINPANIAAAWKAGETHRPRQQQRAGQPLYRGRLRGNPRLRRGQLHRVEQLALPGIQPLGDKFCGMGPGHIQRSSGLRLVLGQFDFPVAKLRRAVHRHGGGRPCLSRHGPATTALGGQRWSDRLNFVGPRVVG